MSKKNASKKSGNQRAENAVVGLYSFDPRPDREALRRYVKNMAQSPENEAWICRNHPIAFADALQSQSKRFTLHFAGEITNIHQVKKALAPQYQDAETDVEILLAAIETWSLETTLSKIDGRFALALWDHKKEGFYLVRDHMGKMPLFAAWAGSQVIFATDLKALHHHPDFSPDIDRAALTSYMRFGHVPAPLCIFQKTVLIPPGCFISIDVELVRGGQDLKTMIEPYWRHKNALEKAHSQKLENQENACKTLENYLDEYLEKASPTAAFLSGNIADTLLCALVQKHAKTPLKTVALHDGAQTENARFIAEVIGTDHSDIILDRTKLPDDLTDYAQDMGQPVADPFGFTKHIIRNRIKDERILSSAGAGTLFGDKLHLAALKNWNSINNMPANLRKPFGQIIHAIPPKYWNIFSRNQNHGADMHKFADVIQKQTEADLYLGMISTWQTPKKFVIDGREDKIPMVDPDNQCEGLTFAENMLHWSGLNENAADAIGDSPFHDKALYEYAWSLPVELKIADKKNKIILRELLQKHTTQNATNTLGSAPIPAVQKWLRNDLKDWAEDLLDPYELKSQNLIDYRHIIKLWEAHKKGRGNHAQKLWAVLLFQQWYREVRTP